MGAGAAAPDGKTLAGQAGKWSGAGAAASDAHRTRTRQPADLDARVAPDEHRAAPLHAAAASGSASAPHLPYAKLILTLRIIMNLYKNVRVHSEHEPPQIPGEIGSRSRR